MSNNDRHYLKEASSSNIPTSFTSREVKMNTYVSPKICPVKVDSSGDIAMQVGFDKKYDFFRYLSDRYMGSPTNAAAIKGKVDLTFGKGLRSFSEDSERDLQVRLLLKDSEISKLVQDYILYGNATLQVIYTRDRKKISKVKHIPVHTIRAAHANPDTGEIDVYYYSHDWSNKKAERIPYPAFGSTADSPMEIMYIKNYNPSPNNFYYSEPSYISTLLYAIIEEESSNMALTQIDNKLATSHIINIPDSAGMTRQQKDMYERRFVDKYAGSNGLPIVFNFQTGEDDVATITKADRDNLSEDLAYINNHAMKMILIGHRITSPLLLGIKQEGNGLASNTEEIQIAYSIFYSTVIRPFQSTIVNHLQNILLYNGVVSDIYFQPLSPWDYYSQFDNQ